MTKDAQTPAPYKVNEVEIPIRSVVLFKHGVAYIEREGKVNDDAKINLFFKSSDMNDVLKSLTVLDLSGGIISSISYAANKSVGDQLNDIMLHIPEQQSLTGLFNQCKGAKVKVVNSDDKEVEGVILGTQTFYERAADESSGNIDKPHISLLVGGCKLVTVSVADMKSITFQEDHLKKDIQHLLNVLISAKKKDSKQLSIHAAGQGERTVYLSYIVGAPLWKTSYRFILENPKPQEVKKQDNEKQAVVAASSTKPECTVQAWAIVDNVMDEDWSNVKLSLVSGLPVSFIHDLYNPRMKKRPVVEVKDKDQAYGAPVLGDSAGGSVNELLGKRGGINPNAASLAAAAAAKAKASAPPVVVRTVEAGDLFHYEIKHAVTVKRNGAALAPIYSGLTQCERLLVYNQSVRDKNPMSSLLVTNTTGIALEGGPVTVIEDDSYVGEAMLDTLRPNEQKMLPYSVELGVTVLTETDTQNDKVNEIYISSGYMYQYFWLISKATYTITNKTDKAFTMVLEHRFNKSYTLFETQDYFEKTDNFYRFKITLTPKQTTTFVVKEKYLSNNSVYLSNVTSGNIQLWLSSTFIDKEIEAKMQELVSIQEKRAQVAQKQAEHTRECELINQSQSRVRENLKVLNDEDGKELRSRYLKRLESEEDQLKKLRTAIQDLSTETNKLNLEYNQKVQAITFRKKLQ